MAVTHRIVIWVFAVHNSTPQQSITMKNNVRVPCGICEDWRMDPRDKGDALTIWIRLLYDLSEAGNPYLRRYQGHAFLYQNRFTYQGYCNLSDKTKSEASWHALSGKFTCSKPTLSPTFISFMRFLASGFRTPSHGVVPAASKSSTLNLCAKRTDELGRKKSTRVVTHFDILSLYYAGIGLCLHKPKLGHGDEKGCDDVTSMESDKQCINKVFWPRQARPGVGHGPR